MFNCLIFSKDRAMQLDLLLRSIKDNFPEINKIHILWKASDNFYLSGYTKLIKKNLSNKNYTWYKEVDFKFTVKKIVGNFFDQKYSLCFADDDVIINKPSFDNILKAFDDTVININLKMNPNINYCHSASINLDKPKFIENQDFLKWDWTKCNSNGDWGYPQPINSVIYSTDYFSKLIEKLEFIYPNNLEDAMNNNRNSSKPYMLSFLNTISLNIPNNITQNRHTPHSNNKSFTIESLNKKFLADYIIDTENLYNYENKAVHCEVDYDFIKR